MGKTKDLEMMRVSPTVKIEIWIHKKKTDSKTMNESLEDIVSEWKKLKKERRAIKCSI